MCSGKFIAEFTGKLIGEFIAKFTGKPIAKLTAKSTGEFTGESMGNASPKLFAKPGGNALGTFRRRLDFALRIPILLPQWARLRRSRSSN
jgi:hypothetical protein